MPRDIRDQLWVSAYYLWYNSAFNAEVATRMVDRIKTLDDVAKVLVALTASGSAVAGWALWSRPGFDIGWAILAGAGAVIAIVHGSLGVPARLKDWLEVKRDFLALRSTIDSLRADIANNPAFDIEAIEAGIRDATARYGELEGRIPSDFFATEKLKLRCQDRVGEIVAANTAALTGGSDVG